MTLLTLEGVACVRGGRLLFENLSLALGPGDAALVTGPNGAGKSSLIRLAGGLLRPAAGRVVSAGCALADENLALDEKLTLRRALGFWGSIDFRGRADSSSASRRLMSLAEVVEDFAGRTDNAMRAMGLEPLRGLPVRLLSTGQRKRAALARVVASGAPLWLLDEPVNGLDGDGQARLEAAIAAHRAAGGAVLVASHQTLAMENAAKVALA